MCVEWKFLEVVWNGFHEDPAINHRKEDVEGYSVLSVPRGHNFLRAPRPPPLCPVGTHSPTWHLACILTVGGGLFHLPPPLAEGSGPELHSELPRYPLKPHENPKIFLSLHSWSVPSWEFYKQNWVIKAMDEMKHHCGWFHPKAVYSPILLESFLLLWILCFWKEQFSKGFPGGPAVKSLSFHCGWGTGSISGWGTMISHATWLQ